MLRRSPRALGLWAGAAALALVTGTLVAGDLASLHRRAGTLGAEEPVVVARTALPLGATVTPGDVTTRRIHASQLPEGVVHDVDAVVGRVLRVPVVRGAFLHTDHLAARSRRGLAAALPAGTRAVRVALDDGLRPPAGSAVDVYASFASGGDVLGTGRTTDDGAVVVAAGAVVLDTDAGSVTLLVTVDQAAALADAAARAALFLALVPPEDALVPDGLTRR